MDNSPFNKLAQVYNLTLFLAHIFLLSIFFSKLAHKKYNFKQNNKAIKEKKKITVKSRIVNSKQISLNRYRNSPQSICYLNISFNDTTSIYFHI